MAGANKVGGFFDKARGLLKRRHAMTEQCSTLE